MALPPSREKALRDELEFRRAEMRRELARRSFREFCRQAWEHIPGEGDTPLIWNWHMDIFCAELESLVRGKTEKRNLVINVPPGSGKSSFVAVLLPAWVWLWWPEWTSLFVSGAEDVSMRDSMKCRGLINSEWYRAFSLPWKLASDQDAKGWFKNTKGGERQATTIGSKGTGKRVHAVFFDDPNDTKDTSDIKLEAVTDSYRYRFQNRLKSMKTGIRCLIQQRTHMKDLTGWIMEHDALAWSRICIRQEFEQDDPEAHSLDPRTEPGELFFPERDDRAAVESQQMILGSVGFAGQHQQRPVPAGGAIFEVGKLIFEELARPGLRLCRGWDFAYSEKKTSDYTVGALCGMSDDGEFWILDIVRQRTKQQLELAAETAVMDGSAVSVHFPTDPGGGNRNADDLARRLAGFVHSTFRPSTQKELTWLPFAAHVRAGLVHCLVANWNAAFRDEMQAAPRGLHDDVLDAVTASFSRLSEHGKPQWFL